MSRLPRAGLSPSWAACSSRPRSRSAATRPVLGARPLVAVGRLLLDAYSGHAGVLAASHHERQRLGRGDWWLVLAKKGKRNHTSRANAGLDLDLARRNKLGSMRPGEDEFAACGSQQRPRTEGKPPNSEWPAFEKRLRQLGYSPRAIAHAFSTLSGPGTVAEALEVLRAPMPESHPIALSFEVTETRGGPSAANRVTITSVERDDSVIHVNYDVVPPPDLGFSPSSRRGQGRSWQRLLRSRRPFRDHREHRHHWPRQHARPGRLKMPLPSPPATMLRIRITWKRPA